MSNASGMHNHHKKIFLDDQIAHEIVQQQDVLLRVSEKLIKANFENIDTIVNEVLVDVASMVVADRVYIFEYDFNKEVANNLYEWCAEGITPQINELQGLPMFELKDWMQYHLEHSSVIINDVSALSHDDPVRMILEPQEIKSLLSVPMFSEENLFGFIGFDSVKQAHEYTLNEQRLLQQLVNNIVMTFEKIAINRALRASEQQIKMEKELMRTTLLSVGDGIISTDKDGIVVLINPIAEKLTGWSRNKAIGKHLSRVFHVVDELTFEKKENPIMHVLKTGISAYTQNHTLLLCKDRRMIPIEDSVSPIKDEHDFVTGAILVFRDVSERLKNQKEIEFLSYHDHLTGLYNRRFYELELERLNDEAHHPMALILADLNGLKLTNDAFGHLVGDELLKSVAKTFLDVCREDDIIARIGGDEFVILLMNADEKVAELLIDRIQSSLKSIKIENVMVSVSMGYAIKQVVLEDMDEVFMRAEDSMYRRKLSESSSMRSQTINMIMNTLFEKNKPEMEHSYRVSNLCETIANEMCFKEEEVKEIKLAGLMHDIGKIGISETVLNNPNRLSDEEWLEMKRHSEIGYRILSSVHEFSNIARFILEHHERIDGSGYPSGIKGDDISVQARIIAVADAYDAMISHRPYRKAMTPQEAIAELLRWSGKHFDPVIIDVFIQQVLRDDHH